MARNNSILSTSVQSYIEMDCETERYIEPKIIIEGTTMAKDYILGTAIKINCVLNTEPAGTAVTISIYDPSRVKIIDSATMTKETDRVFSYVYQSTTTKTYGEYIYMITITANGYSVVEEGKMNFINPELILV